MKKKYSSTINKLGMKLNGKFFLSLALLFNVSTVFSQSTHGQPIQVVPSSPTSSSIERYIDYPVSLFTGVPEISIPIYEIVSGDLTLPISISYHASGIKMKDFSYPVGLGWTLNAGGRISRTLRDKPDEVYASIASMLPNSTIPLKTAMNTLDLEPDVFSFTTGINTGNSGKFLFDGIIRSQNNNQLVSPVFFPMNKNMKFSYSGGVMTLKDPLGRSFKYGVNEINNYTWRPDAWLITEILPSNGHQTDKIAFQYVQGPKPIVCSYEGYMTILDSFTFNNGAAMDPYLQHFDYLYGHLSGTGAYNYNYNSKIKRIDNDGNKMTYISNYIPGSGNNGSKFYIQDCREHDMKNLSIINFKGGQVEFVYNSAKMLSQIKVLNTGMEVIRTANFYYNITVNGAQRCLLDSVVIRGNGVSNQRMVYKFNYHPYGMSTMYSARDFWGYYNGQDYNTTPIPRWTDVKTLALWKYDANFNPDPLYIDTEIGTAEASPSPEHMKAYSLQKVTFPTGGYTEFEFEANQYLDENDVLKDVGGLRVKTIKTFDGSGQQLIKEYKYGTETLNGAGMPRNIPTYDDFVVERRLYHDHLLNDCDPGATFSPCFPLAPIGIYVRERTFLSSPNKELSFVDGSPVWYTYVEESQKDISGAVLGKTEYKFELPEDDYQQHYVNTQGQNISTLYKLIKMGFNLPMLKEKSIYKFATNQFEKVLTSTYLNTPFSDQTRVYTYPFILYQTYNEGVPDPSQWDVFYNPDAGIEILIANGEVWNNSYFKTTEIVEDFNIAGTGKQEINYGYDLNITNQPISISHRVNKQTIVKKFKYPLDYVGLSATDNLTLGIKHLQTNNLLDLPVEEVAEVFDLNGNSKGVRSGKLYQHKSVNPFLEKLLEVKTNKLFNNFFASQVVNGAISKDSRYKIQTQIDAYNSEGDILEFVSSDGIRTTFLWGYNNMYPVAKIINTTYDIAKNYITQSILDNPSDDLTLRNHLINLRNIPGAIVSFYTYKPLVGMTSETDANGRTVYYSYDSFGRLEIVRDKAGRILKKYCYNYLGQQTDCSVNVTAQWTATGNYMCEESGGIYSGNRLREERDNNPSSPTYNQTQWVFHDYNTTICPIPVTCDEYSCEQNGDEYRCVYGACESGYRVNTDSYYDWQSNMYICVYHYEWSDGEWSGDYYEYNWGYCPI